jgi:hypothetical protein
MKNIIGHWRARVVHYGLDDLEKGGGVVLTAQIARNDAQSLAKHSIRLNQLLF